MGDSTITGRTAVLTDVLGSVSHGMFLESLVLPELNANRGIPGCILCLAWIVESSNYLKEQKFRTNGAMSVEDVA